METEQTIRVNAIPFIAPEAIKHQYEIFSQAPDATIELTVVRMVRWAEACVRVGMRERDERLDSLRKAARIIVEFAQAERSEP